MSERRDVPIETDALGAIRLELIGAARRRAAARRRRRQLAATVATGMLMLMAVTAVSAVSGFTTGVPVVDNVLSHEHGEQQVPDTYDGELLGAPPGVDIRPGPGGTSEALDIPWSDGSSGAKGVAYLSATGDVCFVRAAKPGRRGAADARGRAGCLAPGFISDRLTDQPAFVASVIVGEPTIVSGYAAADVETLEITGPGGPLDVQLTRLWTPNTLDAETMRVFAATADVDLGAGGIEPDASSEMMDFRNYSIRAQLKDGRAVEVDGGGF